jgi:hypothetical protein
MCPDDTLPCSSSTTFSNTVCYPADELASSCPVTSIEFSQVEKDADGEENPERHWNIRVSKSDNSLPLIEFRVALDDPTCPSQDQYHPLEIQEDCRLDIDERFEETGFSINQFDLQDQSGVLDLLQDIFPDYWDRVPNAIELKQNTHYVLQSRTVTPWELNCEQDGWQRTGYTRSEFLSKVDSTEIVFQGPKLLVATAAITIFLSLQNLLLERLCAGKVLMLRNLGLFLVWVSSVFILFVALKPDEFTVLPMN